MNTILISAILFVVIMLAGGVLIVFKYLSNKKKHGNKANAIPIILLTKTGNEFKAINTVGYESALNTQRVINIPAINRQFAYPTPDKFINGTLMYLQVSDVEWRPVTFTAQEMFPTQLKELIVKLNNSNGPVTLNTNEKNLLASFLHADKLTPVIDKAFATIYANNVERILKATAVEDNSIWARLQKFMPAIMIIITAVAVVILIYGFLPLYQSVASTMQAGMHIVCQLPNNTTLVSTLSHP